MLIKVTYHKKSLNYKCKKKAKNYLFYAMNLSTFAAAVSANASAGIGILKTTLNSSQFDDKTLIPTDENKNKMIKSVQCCHNSDINETKPSIYTYQDTLGHHQLGTNLNDLSVCWHKMSDANPTSTFDNIEKTLLKRITPKSDNYEKEEEAMPYIPPPDYDTDTKCSFTHEFSSLIVHSTLSMKLNSNSTNSNYDYEKIEKQMASIIKTTSFQPKDMIEQIKLFNKYNTNKRNALNYHYHNEGDLCINGLLKIHWNLKNPIRIDTSSDDNDNNKQLEEQNEFKATSITDLNKKKKQIYFDDLSISKNDATSTAPSKFRSQTVKSTSSNKWKRPALNINPPKDEKDLQETVTYI
jgi:hypothetical protein